MADDEPARSEPPVEAGSDGAPGGGGGTLLDGLPVLDLTDHRGEVGGHLLAELGAEVIRVGRPGEPIDRAREAAFNRAKRRIELDPERPADREALRRLASQAAVVLDAGPPDTLSRFGLDRDALAAENPDVVSVLVTAFGRTGPRAEDPSSELTIAALGGPVRLQGTPDRPPLGFSVPQVWRHAGAEAAVAAMVARARQARVGGPQFVDVSAQSVMTWTLLNAMEASEIQGRDFERTGAELRLAMTIPLRHRCRDGHVVLVPRAAMAARLVEWVLEDGGGDPAGGEEGWEDWDGRIIDGEPTKVSHEELCEAMDRLCLRYTKAELLDRGLALGATIAPINDLADLLAFEHLGARSFWRPVPGPGPVATGADAAPTGGPVNGRVDAAPPGGSVVAPGSFVTVDGRRPAPPAPDRPVPGPDLGFAASRSAAATPAATGSPNAVSGSRAATGSPAAASGSPAAASGSAAAAGFSAIGRSGRAGGGSADHATTGELPFDGLRVADFSWIGVGPISAKCLADHGATVVRVESANRMDALRGQPPFLDGEPGIDRSNFFGTFNTSKRSLAIDLKTPGGIRVAKRLTAWADVVIDSFTPGAMARLGLGPDDIRAENPSVITLTTSLLGCGSAYSAMAGYGYHAAAIAGYFHLVGWADRPPDGPWLAYTDTIGPRFIVPSILAALERRERTGEGCHIEAAQLEMGLQLLGPELLEHQWTGRTAGARGNRAADVVQGVYPCAGHDQWVAVTIQDDEAWRAVRELLGEPRWAAAVGSGAERLAVHDRIDEAMARWTSARSEVEAERQLLAAGVAAGRVQRSRDLLADPQYAHRDFYRRLDHDVMGTVPYAGHSYRIDGYDHGPRAPAPTLGQHTFEVLTDLLGFEADEIAEIAASGALE